MKSKNRVCCGVLTSIIALNTVVPATVFANEGINNIEYISQNVLSSNLYKEGIKSASEWTLKNVVNPSYNNEWNVLGLVRGNINVQKGYYEAYYKNLEKEVIGKKGVLHRMKYTEYSRVIITLTALGYDPTNVGGYNLVEKLFNYDNVSKQGLNGVIFALIALDTKNFEIKGSENSRSKMIDAIIDSQLSDGGFNLSGTTGNPDITAMALQALSKYKDQAKVKASIDKALNYLSTTQLSTGGYDLGEGENVESTVQVLVALNALGIDIDDEKFVKNGNTLVDAIMKFKVATGGFKHVLNETYANPMATEQVLYGLVSLDRLSSGKTKLYDMSDVSSGFTDVRSHWAKEAIMSFVSKGYISGYDDNTFRPDNSITRAEFIKIANKVYGFTQKGTSSFKDVSSDTWFYNDVCIAMKQGYISGYEDNTFRPNDRISRQEVAVILTNIENNKDTNYDKLTKYKDNSSVASWAKSSVEGALENSYISGYEDNTIRPNNQITRAEVVTVLSRIK